MGNLTVYMFEGKPTCSECFREIGMEFKRNKEREIICPNCSAPLDPTAFDQPKEKQGTQK